MSEIQRYAVIETALCVGGSLHEGEVLMVRADEHDRELAALREELETSYVAHHETAKVADDLQQRLIAAEQRNSELESLLLEVSESLWQEDDSGDLFERIDAALKPTESGASE